jgi:dolichol kinase
MALSREEIRRKLLHLLAVLMPIGIFYAPRWSFPPMLVPAILFILFISSVGVETLRFRMPVVQKTVLAFFGSMMRKEEHFVISGWTWVIGAALLCSILFRDSPHISFIVLTLFVGGDAMAALVGIGIGRIKIGKKTLEGSFACLIVCLFIFYNVFPLVPGLLDTWGGKNVPSLIIWVISFVITLFELIPLKISQKFTINDNLAVPIIAGYVMLGLEKIITH